MEAVLKRWRIIMLGSHPICVTPALASGQTALQEICDGKVHIYSNRTITTTSRRLPCKADFHLPHLYDLLHRAPHTDALGL